VDQSEECVHRNSFPGGTAAGSLFAIHPPAASPTEQRLDVPDWRRVSADSRDEAADSRAAANTLPAMRVLVVSNMEPSAGAPQRGSFVRDQVEALRSLSLDVETFDWLPGSRRYVTATTRLRRLLRSGRFDVVHAHYGLAGWCARIAGAEPLVVTFHGTDVRHPVVGPLSRRLARSPILVAGASRALFGEEDRRQGLPSPPGRSAVLPCGADLDRFKPMPRAEAREELGLRPDGRYLLFTASAARRVKRHDRALEVARLAEAELLTLGAIPPGLVPLWINAASAVLITSDNEGFGLAAIEALACEVPVLSTPVGVVPHLLEGLENCHVGPFDAIGWSRAAAALLDDPKAVQGGRRRAAGFGARPLAERVAALYGDLTAIA
jgi:teichuronic acid biosynthesis glycosyltransferase TuaC